MGEGKKKPSLRPPNSKVDVGNSPLLCCATKSEVSLKAPARLPFSDLQKEIQARPRDQVLMLSPSRNPITNKAGLSRSTLAQPLNTKENGGVSESFFLASLFPLPLPAPFQKAVPGIIILDLTYNYGGVLPLSCWSYEDRYDQWGLGWISELETGLRSTSAPSSPPLGSTAIL